MENRSEKNPPCARIEGDKLIIDALGREWIISHKEDMEALWEKLDEANFADERIPYWAELWPASLGLAEWLGLRNAELAGGYCLDCGCGLGFTALVGSWLGARVLACDYELAALQAVQKSAQLSGVSSPECICIDWRNTALAPASIRRLWAADIIYESRSVQPVFNFMRSCMGSGSRAWIAEPGRAIFSQFIDLCNKQDCEIVPVFRIDVEPPMHLESRAHITIWEMTAE